MASGLARNPRCRRRRVLLPGLRVWGKGIRALLLLPSPLKMMMHKISKTLSAAGKIQQKKHLTRAVLHRTHAAVFRHVLLCPTEPRRFREGDPIPQNQRYIFSFFHKLKPLAKNTCPAESRNSFPPWLWALRHGKRHQIGKTGVAPNPGSMPKQVVETRDFTVSDIWSRKHNNVLAQLPHLDFPKKGTFTYSAGLQ